MPTHDTSPAADPLRILVAWRPDADGTEALEFAAWLARTTVVQVRVVMTYMRIWPTSSRNKTSSKYKKWHRQQAERYIRVFRHCQHCRADAAGIPGGTDVSKQLYIRPITLENTFSHG